MISISPPVGHVSADKGKSQNAGQSPMPFGFLKQKVSLDG
jgi:hypothetical protein